MVGIVKLPFLITIFLVIVLLTVTTTAELQVKEIEKASILRQERFSLETRFNKEAKSCKTDSDCIIGTFCPAALGMDTPMCVEEKCICGPGRRNCEIDADCENIGCSAILGRNVPMCVAKTCICGPGRMPKYPVNETRVELCLLAREKIREITEKMREEKERYQELLDELLRLKDEHKECFPQPMKAVPLIAIESKIKKAQAVNEFLEEMKKLKEEMLNNITSQNLTKKKLAEVIREYNEKRKELVRDFVERIREINMERMEEIKEVVVARHVRWEDSVLVNVTRVTISVDNKNITIEPGETVIINVEGTVVSSKIPIRVRNKTIEDAETNQTIKETPEKVRAKIKEHVREMRLERKENMPVYIVSAVKQGRLIGIVPINVNINYEISAVDGSTIAISKPWWSFLVFG